MPAIKIIDRIHLPLSQSRAHFRIRAAGLRDGIAPALGYAGHLRRASDLRWARALFRTSQTLFAMRDRAAGLRDRMLRKPDMAGSTVIAYGAVGIMSAILINDLLGATPANSSVTPTPEKRPAWVEIARPHAAFALESPTLEGLAPAYTVRHHRTGGGRKDELTFGSVTLRSPYVRVSLYRPGAAGMAEPDAFEAVIAVAAESGIDAELRETDQKIKTKFGALPIVAMNVSGRGETRTCLATAGGWSDPRLGLVAWWCNPGSPVCSTGSR